MKLFIDFNKEKNFTSKLKDVEHLDFSLFLDCIPKNQNELSLINIIALVEPNEYFGLHDWVIKNKDMFSVILTYNDKILNTCDNALYFPFSFTFLKPEQYQTEYKKDFKLSHLCGILLKSYGHQLRHEILDRENEFKIPTKFFKTIGDRHKLDTVGEDKIKVFGDAQYGIVIENFSHRGYFSEKLIDCFLMKTIPVYWGCSNIGDFFNINRIINFQNVDDIIFYLNNINESHYDNYKEAIEENYQTALNYINYEERIINQIENIFKYNNLI